MSNSRENVITRHLHGKFGDQVVFRTRNGQSIAANVPKAAKGNPTAAQVEVRDKFRMAAKWAKNVLADPIQLAVYQAKAKNGQTPFVLAVTDFLKPPRISEIDLSGYNGHVGDKILVSAIDDFNVKEVSLKITDPAGELIEEGQCQPDESDMYWQFTATVEVPSLSGVGITAVAMDNPGHTGESTVTLE